MARHRDYDEDDGGPPNFDAIRELLIKNSPFANRKFSDDSLGPRIIGLTSGIRRCVEFANVFVLEPVEEVKSDYGGFFVQIAGTGDCRREQGSSAV